MTRALLSAHLFICLTWSGTDAAGQENWPRFRGANAMSVASDDPRLPNRWSREENVLWKTTGAGTGMVLSRDLG